MWVKTNWKRVQYSFSKTAATKAKSWIRQSVKCSRHLAVSIRTGTKFSSHPPTGDGWAKPLQKSSDIQLMLSLTLIGKKLRCCYLGQAATENLIGPSDRDRQMTNATHSRKTNSFHTSFSSHYRSIGKTHRQPSPAKCPLLVRNCFLYLWTAMMMAGQWVAAGSY